MKKSTKFTFGILGALLIVLVLALWIIPYVRVAVDSNSKQILSEAAQLISVYQKSNGREGSPSQEDVCRDLVYLTYQGIHVEQIFTAENDTIVYKMDFRGENEVQTATYVDVTKTWDGTLYYHITDDSGSNDTIRIRPWGSSKIL